METSRFERFQNLQNQSRPQSRSLRKRAAPPVSRAAPVPNSMMCTPWQGQPPWHRVGRLAASTGTNISTAGNALLLQPLPAGELRLPRTWLGALEPPGVVGLFAREAAWRRAAGALSSGRLVVAVLGSSVTAGCGSSEPWDVWRNGSTRKLKLVQTRCAIEKSWGRRFHDELQAVVVLGVVRPYGSSCSHHNVVAHDLLLLLLLLAAAAATAAAAVLATVVAVLLQAVLLLRGLGRCGEALRTSIQFKNAVDASYFAHCTSGFVPPDAHVVLVEVDT